MCESITPKLSFLFLSFILSFETGFAQSNYLNLSGQILDQETKEPIPFAHIRLQGFAYGTVANVDGKFSLKYPENDAYTIEISTVGYHPKLVDLEGRDEETLLKVLLVPSRALLQEVVITPTNREYELMKKVIERIPENYPTEQEMLRAFSRAIAQKNEDELYYVIENVQRIEKKSYEKPNDDGNVELLESQKVEFQNLDSLFNRFYGGSHLGHWGDLVAQRATVLNLKKLDKYDLTILDTLTWDLGEIYELRYKPGIKSSARGSGLVYIHSESFAILKMRATFEGPNPKDILSGFRGFVGGLLRTDYDYQVDYAYDGSKWRLNTIRYATNFDRNGERAIQLFDELVVTGIDSAASIAYLDRIDYYDVLLHEVEPYDADYWKDDNTILASDDLKRAINQNELKSTAEPTGKMVWIERLSRLFMSYGLHYAQLERKQGSYTFSLNDRLFGVDQASNELVILSYSTGFKVSDRFRVSYLSQQSFKSKLMNSRALTAAYDFNLNPRSRPVYLSPELMFGYQTFRSSLGDIERVNYIGEARDLDASKSDLYIQEREIVLRPGISLAIEKSRKLRFYISGGYNLALSSVSGLYFDEQQSFWKRSEEFVKNGEGGLMMNFESSPFVNRWQFGAGVVWFLR